MARLFISYSSVDKVHALAFANWLASNGWGREDVFLDLHGIGAGERWRDALRKANAACEAVVFLASPDSLASVECQKELEMAEHLGKEIILAILRDLRNDDARLARLSERQFVDLSAEPRDHREPIQHGGASHTATFNSGALAKIKARLTELGVAPESFAWPPRNRQDAAPYPGLEAFGEEDAGIFFGRSAEIMSALKELRGMRRTGSPRMLVIEAASGAGKSSFLRAGLWPRLQRDLDFAPLAILRPARGILTGPDGLGRRMSAWFERQSERYGRTMTPGAIHSAIAEADEADAARTMTSLFAAAATIAAETRRVASPGAAVPAPILAIDQGEELFAGEAEAESRRFLTLLAAALKNPPEGIDPYIIFTIRADSADSLIKRAMELELETPKAMYLPPMSPAAYREVILRPAEHYTARVRRLVVEPLLADALVKDAKGADALPLLAFTLARMFSDYGGSGDLTLDQYRRMGGMDGSIVRALREAQGKVGAAGSDDNLRRLILPRLATWDPDADAGRGAAKRVVATVEDVVGGARAPLARLAHALVEARLLSRNRDTLEVAHEALLRQSPLSEWLEENREFLVWRDGLNRDRVAFQANTRGLLVGRELQIARAWLEGHHAPDVAAADQEFIRQSIAEDERLRSEESERERTRGEADLRAARTIARRTRYGLIAASILAVTAGGVAVWAKNAEEKAGTERDEALVMQSRMLSYLASEAGAAGDHGKGMLLSMEGLPHNDEGGTRPDVAEPQMSLYTAYAFNRERAVLPHGDRAPIGLTVFSPDGAYVLTALGDGRISSESAPARLWDTRTGAQVRAFGTPPHQTYGTRNADKPEKKTIFSNYLGVPFRHVTAAAFSQDSSRLLLVPWRNNVVVWDVRKREPIDAAFDSHDMSVSSATFSPTAAYVVLALTKGETWKGEGQFHLYDGQTGAEQTEISGGAGLRRILFSADGARIAALGLDGTVTLWDAASRKAIATLKGHDGAIRDVAFEARGQHLVTASDDKTARIWDAETGEEIAVMRGHEDSVTSASFGLGGAKLLTASNDKTVRVWDVRTGTSMVLAGHSASITSAQFSPAGTRVITVSSDNDMRLWSAENGSQLAVLTQEESYSTGGRSPADVAFSPDGARVLYSQKPYGSRGITARLWNAETGAVLADLGEAEGEFDRDGLFVLTASRKAGVKLWIAATGKLVTQLEPPSSEIDGASFSPDGTQVITLSDDTATLWDAKNRKGPSPFIESFQGGRYRQEERDDKSPDGTLQVRKSPSASTVVEIIETERNTPVFRYTKHTKTVTSHAFSSNGARVLSAAQDGTARLWSPTTGVDFAVLKEPSGSRFNQAVFVPGDRHIVTFSPSEVKASATVILWDTATAKPIATLGRTNPAARFSSFTPDGNRLAMAMADKAVIWDMETGRAFSELQIDASSIKNLYFSKDGRRLLITCHDGTARIWDAVSGKEISQLKMEGAAIDHADFNADATRVLTTTKGAMEDVLKKGRVLNAQLWNSDSGERLATFLLSSHPSFTADGSHIISPLDRELWDSRTGARVAALPNVAAPGTRREVETYSPKFDGEDGDAAIVDDRLSTITVDNAVILRGHKRDVVSSSFSRDGALVITASEDKTARIWNAKTGATILTLAGHKGAVRSGAFSEDGAYVVTASVDKTARLWDAKTGAAILTLEGHTAAVQAASFSLDGSRVVTYSDDKTVRQWRAKDGAPLSAVALPASAVKEVTLRKEYALGVTLDGTRILAVLPDTEPMVIRAFPTRDTLMEEVRRASPRCLTQDERRAAYLNQDPPAWCIDQRKWPYGGERWRNWLQAKRSGEKLPYPVPREQIPDEAKEAWEAGRYDEAARLQEAHSATFGESANAEPGAETPTAASASAYLARYALFNRQYTKTLAAAERALMLQADKMLLIGQPDHNAFINKAHALMFLGQAEESLAIHKAMRGNAIDIEGDNARRAMNIMRKTKLPEKRTLWEDGILADFKKMRELGMDHPQMKQIEAEFATRPQAKSEQ